MTDAELAALLADESKRIDGDISWSDDEDHSTAVEFRAPVASDLGYPILVHGRYNAAAGVLTYSIIHRGVGRIFGLDLGKAHHNPTCERVPGAHWQRWSEAFGTKFAEPADEVAVLGVDPRSVWQVFCSVARIVHAGTMHPPGPHPMEL